MRILIFRKSKFVSLKKKIDPELFDPGAGLVKRGHPDHAWLNIYIGQKTAEVNDVFKQLLVGGGVCSIAAFDELYGKKTPKSERDFFAFADSINQVKKKRGVKHQTVTMFSQSIHKLQCMRPGLQMKHISLDLVEKFEAYLVTGLGHSASTTAKHLKNLRMYVKAAFGRGLIQSNPFYEYRIKGARSLSRVPLRKNDIAEIHRKTVVVAGDPPWTKTVRAISSDDLFLLHKKTRLYIPDMRWCEFAHSDSLIKIRSNFAARAEAERVGGPADPAGRILYRRLQIARDRFLFMCSTSFAFQDVGLLRWKHIAGDYILKPRLKSEIPQNIPQLPLAKEILDRRRTQILAEKKEIKPEDPVFDKVSNYRFNQQLHEIERALRLPHTLTSHVARHTFATLALQAGMHKEAIKDVMGITDDKTIRVYQRIAEDFKKEEMEKMQMFAVFRGRSSQAPAPASAAS